MLRPAFAGFRRRRRFWRLGPISKNAIALVVEGEVLVSQHIGDLSDYQAEVAFERNDARSAGDVRTQSRGCNDRPRLASPVRLDAHRTGVAGATASRGAASRGPYCQRDGRAPTLLEEPAIGVAFDGTGYGTDGSIWGGEFFVGSVRRGFQRVAWLCPVKMPGGDGAARFPVQAAAGFLAELAGQSELPDMAGPPWNFPPRFRDALAMVQKNVRCFASSSVGRLFDAVAALVGFTREATFEGQAAIWLEHLATTNRAAAEERRGSSLSISRSRSSPVVPRDPGRSGGGP